MKELYLEFINGLLNLPTVQRGFVWKPYQIENLWDSLLRGYPIGSFVVAPGSENNKFDLLDGQQRATAICMGFYNPLKEENSKSFRVSNEAMLIFIDLDKSRLKNDNRKYFFRVITTSHPWGYDKNQNNKTLDSQRINKALTGYFGNKQEVFAYNYLDKPIKKFWPFDAKKAIPIGLFLDAALNQKSVDELKSDINNWQTTAFNYNIKVVEDLDLMQVEDVYEDVKSMLENQTIPLSFLNYQQHNTDASQGSQGSQVDDEALDDVENLFIRLNSGGTPLSGEELNYSLLKTKINKELQKLIEEKCRSFIKPARLITLVYQLFKNQDFTAPGTSISLRVSPRQFQNELINVEKFAVYLNGFLESDALKKATDFISYRGEKDYGLPYFLVNQISTKSPEVLFILLFRIHVKKDQLDENIRKKVIGLVSVFIWLGKGEKLKDYSHLLRNIWIGVKKFDKQRFWSLETVQMGMKRYEDRDVIPEMPALKQLIILKEKILKKSDIRNYSYAKLIEKTEYPIFFESMFSSRDLLLYCQRAALYKWFEKIEGISLDDSNRPFDWDHISPQSLVKGQRDIRKQLREWYNSNGNLRAWPYWMNRSDSDLSPYQKFKRYDAEHDKHSNFSSELLKDSFCNEEWKKLDYGKKYKGGEKSKFITNPENAKNTLTRILERNFLICIEWYEGLNIGALLPTFIEDNYGECIQNGIGKITDLRRWRLDETDDYLQYHLSIEKDLSLFLYIPFENPTDEDIVEFGLWNKGGDFEKLKIANKTDYILEDYEYLYKKTTLISLSELSFAGLLLEFETWIQGLPNKGLNKDLIMDKFRNSTKFAKK